MDDCNVHTWIHCNIDNSNPDNFVSIKKERKVNKSNIQKNSKRNWIAIFGGVYTRNRRGHVYVSDEENAELERQDRLEAQRQKQIELQKQVAEQDQKYSNAKKELNNYLQSLEKATLACNRLPYSEKISPLEKKVVDEIVVNSVLMILVIEEAPIDSGLILYKQKIITGVDRLTECLNRH